MAKKYEFSEIGLLPALGDNVAIATKVVEVEAEIHYNDQTFSISHTILEGHRFAVDSIPIGQHLLSWGLPFGTAIEQINPGDYVSNKKMLESLSIRNLDSELPDNPNFSNDIPRYELDPANFQPGTQVSIYDTDHLFEGYKRSGNRGVGTRNFIGILSTTSKTASFAKIIEERLLGVADDLDQVDGIVSITHTEGGEANTPNNLNLLLQTLAGFMVHPNIGACIAIDYENETVTNKMLHDYLVKNNYPIRDVLHQFFSIKSGFDQSLDQAEDIVKSWLEPVNKMNRTSQPLSNLKIALQCGGSDAFSGVSGNPLAAYVAKEVIRHGGSANLAETDELIGAESYILQNVSSIQVARKFLSTVERFQEKASWHGHTAEGNPSGGNNFRGLYNIAIKSIGAAMKRHPDVRLDHVIGYGEPMHDAGYYFMDSPGNDLESIAGQVAAGSNIIFFVTGNGSITNFPFVPTIKIVTTTDRYNLLKKDMDVNAGAYQDGEPMEKLGTSMLNLTVEIASGTPSIGEKAGHSQVSIWRNWQQNDASKTDQILNAPKPEGQPISVSNPKSSNRNFLAIQTQNGPKTDQIGLVLPTSLCSGQIAQLITKQLNQKKLGHNRGISRFVALAHTEGCGASGGSSERLYAQTLIGHLVHPIVGLGVLLEHGCEKTHNDYIKNDLAQLGINSTKYGWASVQLDGGIDAVTQKIEQWFNQSVAELEDLTYSQGSLRDLHIGLMSIGKITSRVASDLADFTQTIIGEGGTIVIPQNASLLESSNYTAEVIGNQNWEPTISYGESQIESGLHIMETPTSHVIETITGLGATGVDMMVAHIVGHPIQSHRMIPLVQFSTDPTTQSTYSSDLDQIDTNLLDLVLEVASRQYRPKLFAKGNTDFQFTRGLLGISL